MTPTDKPRLIKDIEALSKKQIEKAVENLPVETQLQQRLQWICSLAIAKLVKKETEYAGSWKKRGGVGAFMMLARKFDRIEAQVKNHDWDIFKTFNKDTREEGVLDDIRDLRDYLLLVEDHILQDSGKVLRDIYRGQVEREDSAADSPPTALFCPQNPSGEHEEMVTQQRTYCIVCGFVLKEH